MLNGPEQMAEEVDDRDSDFVCKQGSILGICLSEGLDSFNIIFERIFCTTYFANLFYPFLFDTIY